MAYSVRQLLFAKYMLAQLGFESETDKEEYLKGLRKKYGKHEWNAYYFCFVYTVRECIDNIVEEVELKKTKDEIQTINLDFKKFNTATDFNNIAFCPVSYVISNSFLITKPSNEEATSTGTYLHEKLRLSKRIETFKKTEMDKSTRSISPFLKEIYTSELLFSGHESENYFFVNKEEKFVGTPDYIFKNTNREFFAVEEKYMRKRDPKKPYYYEEYDYEYNANSIEVERAKWENFKPKFFINHKIQLFSYIRNIQDFEIKYGYLVYWYYDFNEDGEPYIHKCFVLKILRTEHFEILYKKCKQMISRLKGEQIIEFNTKAVKLSKCAACVVNKYCGHKTKKIGTLSLPYEKKWLFKVFAPFPEELKKKDK